MTRTVTVTCLGQTVSYDPDAVLQQLWQQTKAEKLLHAVFQTYLALGHHLTDDTAAGVLHAFKCGQADAIILGATGHIVIKPLF